MDLSNFAIKLFKYVLQKKKIWLCVKTTHTKNIFLMYKNVLHESQNHNTAEHCFISKA